jgi:preprotein translocase subunit SecA
MYTDEKGGTIERGKIVAEFVSILPFDPPSQEQLAKQLEQYHSASDIVEFLSKLVSDMYDAREKQVSPEVMRQVERWTSLQVIDSYWMDHLDAIDDLREGIGLRGYGQRDPLVEYKNEAFNMFEKLIAAIDSEIIHRIFKVQIQFSPQVTNAIHSIEVPNTPKDSSTAFAQPTTPLSQAAKHMKTNAPKESASASGTPVANKKNLGRNDPCWCGSGKKWKKCHYPKTG